MATPDPKQFYDRTMPGKLGADYEAARWGSNPFLAAQYDMLRSALRRWGVDAARGIQRILEVGPGPGTWTKEFLEVNPNASYVLVDISQEMLGQAKAALYGHGDIAFVESDLAQFTDGHPFDFFFSSRAIEYMPDKEFICKHIATLLRPGAQGVIVTKMPKPLFARLRNTSSSALHSGQIGPRSLGSLLARAGLEVTGVHMATATVPGAHSARLNRLAFTALSPLPFVRALHPFAESYLIAFKKRV